MNNQGFAQKLSHQIEQFESETGTITAWVNVTSVDASNDTYLYLYYGNNNCLSKEDTRGTWDSDYVSIWHMDDKTPSKVGDTVSDTHDAIKKDSYEPAETDGKIYKAQQFDGNNDYLSISNLA